MTGTDARATCPTAAGTDDATSSTSPPVPIVAVDPTTDGRWAKLTATSDAPIFISPPWISAVAATYDFVPTARVALDPDGTPSGGLAWIPVYDIRGPRLVSLPFGDRADPPVRDATTWHALLSCVPMNHGPFTLRCLENSVAVRDSRLHNIGEAAWHATATDVPPETIFAGFDGAVRQNVRAAERRGVRIEIDTSLEAVHRYYRLHTALRKGKYRLLPQPLELFERIWAEFAPRDGIIIVSAYLGDIMIAGKICLVWNDILYYKFGASDTRHLRNRPNEAAAWNAIRWASEQGLRLFDWGLSDLGQPGLVDYKRKWASYEKRIVSLRIPGTPTRAEADDLLYNLTALLTEADVPDEVTARAGALLYRHFC
jgi:CelD/BcsL family acetyltransferase involved in cellulose biosynthesis